MSAYLVWSIAVLDNWLLLMAARHWILPEDIRERCALSSQPIGMGIRYVLRIDGAPVEHLDMVFELPIF